ncbi:MAG: hypothetical protein FWC00_00665 [Firmicutes bacterium]|nr:hypothetical protein [Bacillota bacterium]
MATWNCPGCGKEIIGGSEGTWICGNCGTESSMMGAAGMEVGLAVAKVVFKILFLPITGIFMTKNFFKTSKSAGWMMLVATLLSYIGFLLLLPFTPSPFHNFLANLIVAGPVLIVACILAAIAKRKNKKQQELTAAHAQVAVQKAKEEREAKEKAEFDALPVEECPAKIIDKKCETKHTGETDTHYSRSFEIYKFTLEYKGGERDCEEIEESTYNKFVVGDQVIISKKGGIMVDIKVKPKAKK